MATVNHSRGARLSRRFGADRPRTHPKPSRSPGGGEIHTNPHPAVADIVRQGRPNPTQPAKPSPRSRRKPAIRDPLGAAARTGRAAHGRAFRTAVRLGHNRSPHATQPPFLGVLKDVCRRLRIVMAATVVCTAALESQAADYDGDATLVLQRCVGDELDRQIEQLDTLIAGAAPHARHAEIRHE